ncbi:hypothetical protein [Sphaerochaeta sp. S2]|uniref:hypothetical protein n=1 Tax=Sphaerochaeta sp. S2 TaxID=2798868 RepID=UPI0018E97734|nr:hypothetical protein [Sphaerochaeta sp. S2]MBJ2357872.1 hypothetical protein [Sphaerochaeta sp. S2]
MNLDLDFSYQSYEKLLKELIVKKYSNPLIGDVLSPKKLLYLRHDVDTDYIGVIPLATIEHSLGMKSTWYFLPDCPVYNICSNKIQLIIRQLADMGHQIGLHIDATQYENLEEMISFIESYYEFLSSFLPISRTLSFHKPADWLLNDVNIPNWVNAYQKEYYSEVIYVSDSNRREFWKEVRLYTAINENKSLTLLTHPLWWKEASLTSEELFEYTCKILGTNVVEAYLKETCKRYS